MPRDADVPRQPATAVRDVRGRRGRIVGELEDGVRVELDDGRQVLLPREALTSAGDGSYVVGFDLDAPERPAAARGAGGVIPVLSEELVVERRARVTGGVRLHKTVAERTALVDEPVVRERVTVERVAVGRPLDDGRIPTVREVDGVLVVPVIEEQLVVEKRLVLKEELHVRRVREESRDRQEVRLLREQVDVERYEAEGGEQAAH
jgi:uncharacterized protein (TIGR02271 family)